MSEIVESQYEREQRLKSEQREREDTRQTPPPNNDPQLEREERLNQGVPKFRDTHGNVVSEPVVAVTPPLPAKVIDPKKVKPKQLKVRALNTGQYKGRMYNHGDVFYVDEGLFADAHHGDKNMACFGWMEKIDRDDIDKPVVVVPKDETPEQKAIREHSTETSEETERRVRAEDEKRIAALK